MVGGARLGEASGDDSQPDAASTHIAKTEKQTLDMTEPLDRSRAGSTAPVSDCRSRADAPIQSTMAYVVSLNVGLPREIQTRRGPVRTAIFKSSTDQRLRAEGVNLEGDRQADLENHGGSNKAIYGYPIEHYSVWSKELERHDFEHGQFGENLTTEGLLEREVYVGDLFAVGSAILQVTQPRSPCFKLGLRMNDPKFVKTFLRSGRPGFYFGIVQAGDIGSGDELVRIERGETDITVHEVWELSYGGKDDPARLRLALQIATLEGEWSEPMRSKLAR